MTFIPLLIVQADALVARKPLCVCPAPKQAVKGMRATQEGNQIIGVLVVLRCTVCGKQHTLQSGVTEVYGG